MGHQRNRFMGGKVSGRRRQGRKKTAACRAARLFETLETRQLLTANLYLDFGDHLPAGGLNMTVQELRDTLGAGGIQGPDLRTLGSPAMTDATPLNFTGLSTVVTTGPDAFDYNGDATIDDADYTDLRDAVVTLLQRYYAPFDLNVQIAPAIDNSSDAAYRAGIVDTLQMGDNTDGERDTWLFVSNIVRTDTMTSVGDDTSLFGLASGADVGGNNATEDTVLLFADNLLRATNSLNNATADTALAHVAAHDAAHSFGLAHTKGTPAGSNDDLLSQADIIQIGGSAVDQSNFNIATRFPLTADSPPPNQIVNYDRLADDNLLGVRANSPAYVTGTGANDIITITSAGANMADVTVTPYANADFTGQIDVPGQAAGTPYAYTIDTTNGILVEGSYGHDRFVIDATLGVNITVRGMGDSSDEVVFQGDGTLSGTYTPNAATTVGLDGNTYLGGQLVAGATVLNLEEFASGGTASTFTADNFSSFTYTTPGGADDLEIDLNSFDTDEHRIKGSSGGVPLVDLVLHQVQQFTLDAATNDTDLSQNDTISVKSNGMAVADLLSMQINTGAGDDTLTVDFSTGLVRMNIGFDAGGSTDDNDKLVLTGDPGTAIGRETYRVGATEDAGVWVVDPDDSLGAGASGIANGDELVVNFTNVEPVDSDLPAAVFDVIMNSADNQAAIVDGGVLNTFDSLQVTDLNSTFETFRFARKATVRIMGQAGADSINADYTTPADSLTTLEIYGHVADDVMGQPADDAAADLLGVLQDAAGVTHTLFGQAGDDIFTVGNGDLTLLPATVTINAGDGTKDSLVVNDSGRDAVVDYYVDPTTIAICTDPGPPAVHADVALFDDTLEFARLDATNGVNRFDVTPSTTVQFTINGNLPSSGMAGGDLLSVRFAGTTGRHLTYDSATGNGMWQFDAPTQTVLFESIERITSMGVVVYGADAAAKGKPTVKVVDPESSTVLTTFLAYEANYRGGVRVALADVTGDGIPEIITAPGKNHVPVVNIFELLTGKRISGMSFHAFSKSFRGGVNLAVGDLNGDGLNDVAVAPSRGKTEIRAFLNNSASTPTKPFAGNSYNRFLAFDKHFIGGATIAAGDVLSDGNAEIIVGSGTGMRAEVRIFDGLTTGSKSTPAAYAEHFFPFDNLRGGVWVATANIDADAKFELLVGAGVGGRSQVATYDLADLSQPVALFTPYSGNGNNAPVRVTAADIDGDGQSEIFIGQGPDGRSQKVRTGPPSGALVDLLMETDAEFRDGLFLAADGNGESFMC